MRRTGWALLIAVAMLGSVAALTGCCGLLPSTGTKAEPAESGPAASAKVLADFFDAKTKQGKFDATSVTSDGESSSEKAEFWVSGRNFRIDYYDAGTLRISIRCADGKSAYFCHPDTKTAEPSVATPDVYLRKFTKPDKPGESLGVDPKTGAEKVLYVLRETSNVEGSSNPWYVEDLVYSIKDGRVLSVVDRAGIPHEGEETALDTHTTTFTELKTGEAIPAETFAVPYPIKSK